MELLDVLDEKGNATGEVMGRKEVHANGIWHRCVHVWILNSKGELLLQRRSTKVENYPGMFDVSAAGHVSAGESKLEAAVKELGEEIGVTADPAELIVIDELKVQVDKGPGKGTNNHFDDIYLLERDIDIRDLKLQKEEVDTVEFVPWRELRERVANEPESFVKRELEYKTLFEFLEENFGDE